MFAKLLGMLLVATVLWAVAARSSSGAGHRVVYTVKPYDTLWSIAASHYGGDIRDWVWKLEQRNGVNPSSLRPGRTLVLP